MVSIVAAAQDQRPVDGVVEAIAKIHEALARAMPEILSDRAARRLCERLVELSVLRELTVRDTFRLYGV